MDEAHIPIEKLEVFKRFAQIADEIWNIVRQWTPFEKDTLGKQLVRAIDSVGANLVEGDGRQGNADALRFLVIARASAREAKYWVDRAQKRNLIPDSFAEPLLCDLVYATRQLNNLIKYRRSINSNGQTREDAEAYEA